MMNRDGKRHARRRDRWWTPERMIAGLKRFREDFGFCPTGQAEYSKHQQHTGRAPDGGYSSLAWHQKYPSANTVLRHWPTMRQAWQAAGFDVGNKNERWSAHEDWFIIESLGILHRDEVAKMLGRSAPAVKRRIYDLGDLRSYNRWGVTLQKASQLLKVDYHVIKKYLDCGLIPYLKGVKVCYVSPADLLIVGEVDWTGDVPEELAAAIRRAIAQRIAQLIKHGSYRDREVYRFHKKREFYSKTAHRDTRLVGKAIPEPPNTLAAGDWVRTTRRVRRLSTDVSSRVGRIETVWYSWQRVERADGTRSARWVARVEFPKIRTITGERDRRVRYTIPLDCLEPADEPRPEPREPSMHPEAVKARERVAAGEFDHRRSRMRARLEDFTQA